MQVRHEGGRYLDPCDVDPPPHWKALGRRVDSGQCPDGVICLADGKQSSFPGPATGRILIGKGTALLEGNVGPLPLGSSLLAPRGAPFGGSGNYSATLPRMASYGPGALPVSQTGWQREQESWRCH